MRWIACLCICVFVHSVAHGATDTWSGAVDTNWSTSGNWSGGSPPGSGDTAEFATGGTAVTVDGAYTIATVLLDGSQDMTFTVSNGSANLTITAGITMSGSNNYTWGCPIILGSNQTWNQGGSGLFTVTAAISGSASLTKSGSGSLTFSGTDTYSGDTVVTAGTLDVAAPGALIGSDLINPISGGTLTIEGTVTVAPNGAFAAGTGAVGTGTVTVNNGGVLNIGGGTGGLVGRCYVGGELDNNGTAGLGILNVNAGGTVNVASPGSPTTGDGWRFWVNPWSSGGASAINLNGGIISTNREVSDGGSGTSQFNFNGGTLQAAVDNLDLLPADAGGTTNVRNGGGTIDTQAFVNITMSRIASHSNLGGDAVTDGGLTKIGSGTLTWVTTNTYTGNTTISAGVLSLTNVVPPGATLSIASGAVLQYNDSISTIDQGPATITGAGTVQKTGVGTLRFGQLGAVHWDLVAGSLVDVEQGTLIGGCGYQDDWASNLSSLNIASGALFRGVEANVCFDSLTGAGTFAGGYVNSYVTSTIGVNNGSGTFTGIIADDIASLVLTKVGTGTQTLNGASTYTGGSNITTGTINGAGQALGSGLVTVGAAGTLSVSGSSGLAARYYNEAPSSPNFASLLGLQNHLAGLTLALGNITSTLNFGGTGNGFPAPYNSSASNFETIFSGRITIGASGVYTFNTASDDGSMLWIDGSLVVSNNFSQAVTTRSGTIALSAGIHDIVVGYYQGGGGYGLDAQISGAGNTTMVDLSTGNVTMTPDLVVSGLAGTGSVVAATGNLVVGYNNTSSTFSGIISGGDGLVKLGSGTLTLAAANTFSGLSAIYAGTLQMGANGALLQTGSMLNYSLLDLGGYSLTLGSILGSGIIDNSVSASPTLTLGQGDASSSFTGIIQNTAGVVSLAKVGSGTLALQTNNTYGGSTIVTDGTLSLGTVQPPTATLAYWLDASKPSNYVQSGGVVSSWTDLSGNNNDFVGGNGPVVASGVINGLDALSFTSTETLAMGNATTPATVFIVNQVTTANNNLDGIFGPTGSDNGIRLSSPTSWSNPGNNNDFTNPQGFMYINGVAGSTFTAGQAYLLEAYVGSSTPVPWGSTTLSNYLYVYGRIYTGYIAEVMVYSTALDSLDRATVESYLLGKWVNPSLGGSRLPSGTNVQIAAGATLDLSGIATTIGTLSGYGGGSGTLTNNGNVTATLTLGNVSSATFAGAIQDGLKAVTLTKIGSGSQTLTGASAYSGTTTVSAGTLVIDAACTTSAVSVASGATLGGIGSVSGAVTVNAGGSLTPGDVSPGTLTIGASGTALSLSSTSTCTLALGTAGDLIACSGSSSVVTLGGTLDITNAGGINPGTYQLMTFTGGSSSGSFSTVNMPPGLSGVITIDNTSAHAVLLTVTGPTIATNTGLTVAPGASVTVESSALQATTPGLADSALTYTLTTSPTHGALRTCSGGNPGAIANGGTFTQADIDNDLISYEHGDLVAATDSLQINVTDTYGRSTGATTVAITVSGTGLMNGLQGWWRFDDTPTTTTTTTALDSSGNNRSGTLVNLAGDSSTWVTGQINGAIALNGSTNYVDVPSGISLANSSLTMSAWAKRTATGAFSAIVGQGTNAISSGLQFGFDSTDQFYFGWWGDATYASSTYTDSLWHHWVSTYDSSSHARVIYRDGVAVASGTASSTYTDSGDLRIGDSAALDAATLPSPFPGTLDELRIYNRVCSPGETKLLYQQAAPVLSGVSSTQTFTQFAGAVPLSSSTVAIAVADCLYFSGGSLLLANTNGTASGTDVLAFTTTGGITVSGGTVSYSGNAFATIDGSATGLGGLNLLIHFTTTAATPTAVAALINALTFSTSGTPVSLTTRAVTLTVSDIAFSATATVAMSVVGVPVITARQTQDLTGDGSIDNILVTTDLALNDTFTGLTATVAGYTVTGYAPGPFSNQFYIQFTQGGTPDTGTTPVVQITANTTLAASAGGQLMPVDGSGVVASDGAAPVLMSSSWTDGGSAGVSAGDTLSLTFSEPVTATSLGPADLGLPVLGDILSSTPAVSQSGSNTVTLTLAGTPQLCPGGTYSSSVLTAGAPSGIYIAVPSVITDAVGLSPVLGNSMSAVDIGPTTTLVAITWIGATDPQTWALNAIPVGYVASSHGSSLDLQLANVGNCSVAITITSGTSGPSNSWSPAASAGVNEFLVKADNSSNAGTSGAGPLVASNYDVTVGSSATSLYSILLSGVSETFAIYFQAPLSITSGATSSQSIAIVLTAAVTP